MCIGHHVKYPLFLYNETRIFFPTDFLKSTQISNFMKIRLEEQVCSMRTDRPTDMTNLIVAFHNVANAPKNIVYT